VFDLALLRKSVARLDRTMLFEPDWRTRRPPFGKTTDGRGRRKRPAHGAEARGRGDSRDPWVPPASRVRCRPRSARGCRRGDRGLFDLSTYTASISLLAFAHPILPLLGAVSTIPFLPVLSLRRPFSASDGWKSGFVVGPQLGWKASAVSYPVTQIQQRLLPVLSGIPAPDLEITVEGAKGEMITNCQAQSRGFGPLRRTATVGLQLLERRRHCTESAGEGGITMVPNETLDIAPPSAHPLLRPILQAISLEPQSREWFQDSRFGLFIHWGVYSVLGDGEWVMNNRRCPSPSMNAGR